MRSTPPSRPPKPGSTARRRRNQNLGPGPGQSAQTFSYAAPRTLNDPPGWLDAKPRTCPVHSNSPEKGFWEIVPGLPPSVYRSTQLWPDGRLGSLSRDRLAATTLSRAQDDRPRPSAWCRRSRGNGVVVLAATLLTGEPASLFLQHFNRVHPCGAPRGQRTGCKCDRSQQHRYTADHPWIERPYSVDLTGDCLLQPSGGCESRR